MDKFRAEITEQKELIKDIFSMWVKAPELVAEAHSGQFVSVYSKDASRLLPRPISICDLDKEKGLLRLVYRIAGAGTLEFSQLTTGDTVDILGPLGNGYDMNCKNPVLLGGGIGIPPMLRLARELRDAGISKENLSVVLGYRDTAFLLEEFEEIATVYTTSDNGAVGIKGNVIDGIKEYNITGDMIFSCGPTPMLRAVKAYSEASGIRAQLSLEEKMACGVGACLACVCESTEVDDHSKVHNKRICKDGPVFYAEEVVL